MKKTLHITKIDGIALDDTNDIAGILDDFAALDSPKILVHGNGKEALFVTEKLGLLAQMVNQENSQAASLKLLKMVYTNLLNTSIVGQLQARQLNALGMNGADLNAYQARKIAATDTEIDSYHTGKIEKVNGPSIHQLLSSDIVPVFSTITHDHNGLLLTADVDDLLNQLVLALEEYYHVEIKHISNSGHITNN